MDASRKKRKWESLANKVAQHINFAWWLSYFLPAMVGVSLVQVCVILIAKREGSELTWCWIIFGVLTLVAALVSLYLSKKHFFKADDGLVRLERHMKLRGQLSTANAGRIAWPTIPDKVRTGIEWQSKKIATPLIVSLFLILFSIWIPVTPRELPPELPVQEPIAWNQVETWLDVLEKEDLVDEKDVTEIQEQIEELRNQPTKEWYDHNSLEASDALRKKVEKELKALKEGVEALSQSLAEAEELAGGADEAQSGKLGEQMKEHIDDLESGNFALSPKFRKKLEELNPENFESLTPEEAAELAKQLKEHAQALKEALEGQQGQQGQQSEQGQEGKEGEGQQGEQGEQCEAGGTCQGKGGAGDSEEKDGEEKDGTGGGDKKSDKAGISRGPGSVPLDLAERNFSLQSGDTEAVLGRDQIRSAPGDVIHMSEGQHEVDKNLTDKNVSGGSINSTGKGSIAVWKGSVTPQEQSVLERYFK